MLTEGSQKSKDSAIIAYSLDKLNSWLFLNHNLEKKTNKESQENYKSGGLEYKNVEYSLLSERMVEKVWEMEKGNLKIKSHTEKNNIFKKFSPWNYTEFFY